MGLGAVIRIAGGATQPGNGARNVAVQHYTRLASSQSRQKCAPRPGSQLLSTAAIAWATAGRFFSFSAATQMRPESTP